MQKTQYLNPLTISTHCLARGHWIGRHSSMSVSQLCPVYPATQSQVYVPGLGSRHVPPFSHGWLWHSEMSVSQLSPLKPYKIFTLLMHYVYFVKGSNYHQGSINLYCVNPLGSECHFRLVSLVFRLLSIKSF